MNYNEKDHCVPLYLPKPLKFALLKLQSDRELGRSYAGLLAFTEGLFQLHYINEETHNRYVKRYSETWAPEPCENKPVAQPEKPKIKHPERLDYSVMTYEQLQERYLRALRRSDFVETQHIRFESNRRGLKLKGEL